MSDGVKFVFKTLFKIPIFILAAYLIMNVLGIVTTFFKVQGVQYGLENIVVENNYISRSDLEKLMPQLWALGNHYEGGTWTPIAYVDEIGFLVQNETSGELVEIPLDPPNAAGTNASTAANNAVNAIRAQYTNQDLNPTNRTQYGTPKIIGFYAKYAVLWPLTVYDNGERAVAGYNGGTWQNNNTPPNSGAAGSIFTATAVADTGDFATDSRNHANVVVLRVGVSNTVVGIKYYADMH